MPRLLVDGWGMEYDLATPSLLADLESALVGYGLRNVLAVPVVQAWINSVQVERCVERWLAWQAWPIAATWFDKTVEANWQVPWHQDVQVALKPFAAEGWGPWTTKQGIPYVALPEPWRSARITVRLHVDACGDEDGPLQLLPGTHRHGLLKSTDQDGCVATGRSLTITARSGDALVLHPLLLHRSSPVRTPSHRRVLQVEWCSISPPVGVRWKDLIP